MPVPWTPQGRALLGGANTPPLQVLGTKFGPLGQAWNSANNGDATHHGETSRFRIDMPPYDMELKAVEYWNGRIGPTGEVAGDNAITAKSAWEPAGKTGASLPLYTADGVTRSIIIPAGSRQRFYPGSKIIVPGGSLPYCLSFVSVTGTQTFPVGRAAHQVTNSMGENCNYFSPSAGVDFTDTAGGFTSNASLIYAWGASGIYGIPADRVRRKCVWICADSRNTYSGSDASAPFGDTNGYAGWAERKIQNNVATINSARAGSYLHYRALGMVNEAALCAPYVTDMLIDLGINDLNGGTVLATLQADLATIIAVCRGYGVQRFHVATQSPNPAATTNGWVDGGSSLKAMDTVRQALNTWLRTKPLGITTCIDVCAYVEDQVRPGFWVANNPPYTPEGLHDNLIAQTAKGQALDLNILA